MNKIAAPLLSALLLCSHAAAAEPPCADGERVVFAIEDVCSVCLIPDGDSPALVLNRAAHEDKRIVSRPANAKTSARVLPLAGGGYAYLRFDDDGTSYYVYSGIGRFKPNSREPVAAAGLVVIHDDGATESYDVTGDHTSALGPDLFAELDIPEDADEFLPDPEAAYFREEALLTLSRVLEEETRLIRAAGRRAVYLPAGERIINGLPAIAYVFGEEDEVKFTAWGEYAVDVEGTAYLLDIHAEGAVYKPLPGTISAP